MSEKRVTRFSLSRARRALRKPLTPTSRLPTETGTTVKTLPVLAIRPISLLNWFFNKRAALPSRALDPVTDDERIMAIRDSALGT